MAVIVGWGFAAACCGQNGSPDGAVCRYEYVSPSWNMAKTPSPGNVTAIWVSGNWPQGAAISGNPSDVWAVTMEGEIWGLGPFLQFYKLFSVAAPLRSAFGTSDGSVWVVGDGGTILRWKYPSPTTEWVTFASGVSSNLMAMGGSDSNNIWVAGEDAVLLKWDGSSWTSITTGLPVEVHFTSIWVADADDVWLASSEPGTLFRYYQGSLLKVDLGTSTIYRGLDGSLPDDGWAVGEGGSVAHWDGKRWSPVQSSSSATLHAVWAGSPSSAWAAGAGGVLMSFDGRGWSNVSSRVTNDVLCVAGAPASRRGVGTSVSADGTLFSTWAGGSSGAILAFSQAEALVCTP